MKKLVYIAIGVGILYVVTRKNAAGQNALQTMGASKGAVSSAPSTQYPFTVPQATRADNNSSLNNQPWARQIVNQVQNNITPANVASAAGSIAGIFQNLFAGSTGSPGASSDGGSAYDSSDLAMSTQMVGSSNMGGGSDSSLNDGSYSNSDFGFATA